MSVPRVDIYLLEILRQVDMARAGVQMLNEGLKDAADTGTRVLGGAQALLTAAAQISKLLDPPGDRRWTKERRHYANRRGEALMQIIHPDPILMNRAVRNSVEHMDTRLDDFIIDHPDGTIMQMSIGPGNMIDIDGPAAYMRYLHTDRLVFAAMDDEIDLQRLWNAILRVEERAKTALQRD